MSYTLLVSGYNQSQIGGIQEITLGENGALRGITALSGIVNPSFLAYLAASRSLFAVSELPGGAELVCMDYRGAATAIVSRATVPGQGLCHVGVSPDGKLVGGACYSSGDAVLFACSEAGFGREVFHKCFATGAVVSHAHCMCPSPDSRFFYNVDLGRDCVDCIDCRGEVAREQGRLILAEGDGPRQLMFHPTLPIAYLMTEYSNVVYTLAYNAATGELSSLQRLSTLPEGYAQTTYGASVAFNAATSTVYASNRGMESIAVYAAAADGLLTPSGIVPCGGSWPRHIAATRDGRYLLVANERSSELAVLPVDGTGVPGVPVAKIGHKGCSFVVEI